MLRFSPFNVSFSCCCFSFSQSCPTLCNPNGLQHAKLPCPSQSPRESLFKLMSIESVMPSNHLVLCHPLLFLHCTFPSIRVFSSESALHIRWSNYWSFSFSNSPSNEYLGLTSFRIDWFDLLAVQGTLKSLCQYHSLKASVLQLQLWWQTKFYARTHQKSKNFTQFLEQYDICL